MPRLNAENERVKRRYLGHLAAAQGFDEATIDAHAKALARFEEHTKGRSFKAFHVEQAKSFRDTLGKATGARGKPLAKSTVQQTLNALRRFFIWLADQPGYKRAVTYSDAEYLRPSRKDALALATQPEKPFPSVEQVRRAIEAMPSGTEVERRDRAIMAFALLTGARDDAIASLQLRHVDVGARRVVQDGRVVRTKGGKTIETVFFPIGDDLAEIVGEWVEYLRGEKLFAETDPLFPRTKVGVGADRRFAAQGIEPAFWSSADPIRKVFRLTFRAVGLPYFNPHSLRKTLVQLGERICRTPEEFKAWSQNLGHENVSTTFTSYGKVSAARQAELLSNLAGHGTMVPQTRVTVDQIADALAAKLKADGTSLETTEAINQTVTLPG